MYSKPRLVEKIALAALLGWCWSAAAVAQNPHAAEGARRLLREYGVAPTGDGAIEYLRQCFPESNDVARMRALVDRLGDNEYAARESATQQLLRSPHVSRELLRDAAASADPEIRWRAQTILRQVENDQSHILVAALRVIEIEKPARAARVLPLAATLNPRPHYQAALRSTMQAVARAEDLPIYDEWLRDARPAVRVAAIAAVWKAAPPPERERLAPLLQDPGELARLEAARALCDGGDRRGLPVLVALLDSDDASVRAASHTWLRGLTQREFRYVPYESAEKRQAAAARWREWLASEGDSATLRYPVKVVTSARGDLGGNLLIATGSQGRVAELDPSGKEVWSYKISSWSAEKLANGNYLISSFDQNKVVEVDSAGAVVWEYAGVNAINAKPLLNGNVLIADFSGARAIEVDPEKKIVWQHKTPENCFDIDRLPNGNTIFGCPNLIREITPDGAVVREWKIPNRLNGFQALPTGNVLVADYGANMLYELDAAGERVWTFGETGPCDVFRLEDGTTLAATTARIIEIAPDGKTVREIAKASYGSARK